MINNEKPITLAEESARMALINGDYEKAYNLLTDLLSSAPDNAEAYFLLSRIAYDFKNHQQEQKMLAQAYKIEPRNLLYVAYLARANCLLGDSAAGADMLEIALGLEGHTPEIVDVLGITCNRLNLYKEASHYFHMATELDATNAANFFNLASTFKFCGDLEGAKLNYEKAISLKPDYYKAHAALSNLAGITPEHNHIHRLQKLFSEVNNEENALYIAHALSKEFEAINSYDDSFAALNTTKKLTAKKMRYDFAIDKNMFDALSAQFCDTSCPNKKNAQHSNHIFIVGMPRTGTTVVERILSSYPAVATGGELYNFSNSLKQMQNNQSRAFIDPAIIAHSKTVDFEKLGKEYSDSVAYLLSNEDTLINKLPLNILYADLIIKALPKSKIICLDRHPLDTIMSNYRQLFSFHDSIYSYSLDLEDTTRFYIYFRTLVNRLLKRYPDNFHLINYEELVKSPEVEIKKMTDFCGLPWDDTCLRIEDNNNPVATASSVQVRQPISTRSIGQWQHYDKHLTKVKEMLSSAHINWED